MLGVTGSVGKTSTKDMARVALTGQGYIHAAEASYNNHWGVPLTLARCPRGAAFAAVEIGMNNPGEIAPLSRLARPHVAVVTAIGAAHIGHLGGLDAIAAEKAAIAAGKIFDASNDVSESTDAFLQRLVEVSGAQGPYEYFKPTNGE